MKTETGFEEPIEKYNAKDLEQFKWFKEMLAEKVGQDILKEK